MMRRTNRPDLLRRYPNVVPNAHVELGGGAPDAWFFTLTGTEWTQVEAHSGSRALRLQVDGEIADWRSSLYPAMPKRRYRVGLWVKGMGTPETVLAARWFADPNGEVYLTEQWLVLGGSYAQWTPRYHHVMTPEGAQSGDLMFRAAFPTTADLYGDDFTVRRLS